MSNIVVFGASFIDFISYVPRFPAPGETLSGTNFAQGYGGKGANQAVMIARLVGNETNSPPCVSLISAVGGDANGKAYREYLSGEGVNTAGITVFSDTYTGNAPITVNTETGENIIVINRGAVANIDASLVAQVFPTCCPAGSKLFVCQNEVPFDATVKALQLAKAAGLMTIWNPAPAPTTEVPADLLRLVDVLVPNAVEAAQLLGKPATEDVSESAAEGLCRELISRGVGSVVVTLGSRGALVVSAGDAVLLPCPKVKAVDTTGAGDCFVGSLAYGLVHGKTLQQSASFAVSVAAISVTRCGTQASYPYKRELPEDLKTQL